MQGVITKVQVLANPLVIVESFGVKVLLRALLASAHETFLEIVRRAAEEEAHEGMEELHLLRTVKRFAAFECRVRDLYLRVSDGLAAAPAAARFFASLSAQEEGHAIVLTRVRREVRKGRLWKESRDVHRAAEESFEARLSGYEGEVCRGVTLARALEIVEGIEGSELNVVFDTLNASVDMRSRARFERFFVLTQKHLAFCRAQVEGLRTLHGIG
jgi:hypothetical protein